MYDDGQAVEESSSGNVSTKPPKSYNFLIRLSRSMGTAATKSYVEVKNLLVKEITMPTKDRAKSGMPKMVIPSTPARSDSDHDEWGRASESDRGDENADKSEAPSKMEPKAASGKSGAANDDTSLSPNQEGTNEGASEKAKQVEEGNAQVDSAANLKKVVAQAHEVLATANTVFPITLFPDTVFVDRTKVTIIRRNFFWSSDVMSIRIEDVLNVSASVGPLFGSLTIASRVMSTTDHFQINHFWRADAAYLKHIIQGYVIAQHNNIDTAHLEKDELVETLKELGHDSGI